ncbi:hypothetical protein ABUE38_06225 [Pediococcus parvulus]|uniref:Uncharacterized protein n=1 Tax=Pediococcus parvulus TaxID=54062 RepID=A0AAP5WFF6_9LACO|nr:hypothetical protein [Pediococcus parvulus]MDV7693710.1 hypothetical protein [Pediococcus parvulus]OAD64856.1 hypothetical protein A7K95_02260 [Pediococcus parvulus]
MVYAIKGLITVLGFVIGTFVGGLFVSYASVHSIYKMAGIMNLIAFSVIAVFRKDRIDDV